ncbi:MAG TPA: hypothetical protein VKB11_04135 [Acidimicrobiia bacterium]|nr:hypothetical protein [Acidimicrobiia bacterium]
MNLFFLAQEEIDRTLWYPTILGILVVAAGIVLFCGSIYLLLGTNLGARLGFLVAFTGLAGFMVVLSILWVTTQSPLNTLKGRTPEWNVQQVVNNLDDARNPLARKVTEKDKVDAIEAANVKAEVDERLVTVQPTAVEKPTPEDNKFARFDEVTEYVTPVTYEVGGSDPEFLDFEFTHKPLIAIVEVCAAKPTDTPFGVPPPEPECDPTSDKNGFVILSRDLGQLRLPPILAMIGSAVLFGLGLLGLHWRERDEAERAKQAEAGGPAPVPART